MTEHQQPGGSSIWLRAERSSRGPVPERSRAQIAAAGVALADASGLAAVTMRSVAAAIGTGPASLYRYFASREQLLEVMADLVRGELSYAGIGSRHPVADLLGLARQGRALYLRHQWLLEVPASGSLPGPNAIAFLESALAALEGVELTGPAKLETIAIFSGAVRLFAETEIDQQRAGQDAAQWQGSLVSYLGRVVSDGRHPHLAAALSGQPPEAATEQDDLFTRAMTRILTGLLPPGPSGT
jgi:AcrR family transcriptional regulator